MHKGDVHALGRHIRANDIDTIQRRFGLDRLSFTCKSEMPLADVKFEKLADLVMILNSSVDHDESSEYSEKTRTYRGLWILPSGESIILDNLLIFIRICHVFRRQLRNLG
jgi:hypothetical protein